MVLRKLANATVRPLYIIFEMSRHKRSSQRLEEHYTYLQDGQQGQPGELQPSLLHLKPSSEGYGSNIPGIHSQLHDDKVTSQHGFTLGKLCLTNTNTSYSEMASCVGTGRAVTVARPLT